MTDPRFRRFSQSDIRMAAIAGAALKGAATSSRRARWRQLVADLWQGAMHPRAATQLVLRRALRDSVEKPPQ